jgi:hypothetical protein
MIAQLGSVKKKIALLAGCLLVLACSSNGERGGMGQGGRGGGQTGGTGGSGHGGSPGSAGDSGNGGGQPGGSPGSAGNSGGGHAGSEAGGRGGSGATAGNTGGGGQAGAAGQGGESGGHAGGRAGHGGAGGGGGKAGQGGAGGNGPSCTEIQTAYAKAISNARMCSLASSATQCTHLVPGALSCGCPVWVNDTTELDRIKAQWDAAGCTPGIVCPALACLSAGTHAVCVPIDSGDVCMGANGPT